ncbi:MAG: 3-phosphoshikimate 1-carboxyvinyltransferase, partial [Acidimicrobiales bacterium]|nr:3-phosphoshikimate 1-carboxyvinyltransferase [Acidimicrobiales bacterium]
PTLAVVAAFADVPTRITGVGFIRDKESDRIGALAEELRRCGIGAVEEPDGLVIVPSPPHPALVRTRGDHRLAMAFSVLGLVTPGIEIDDPGCVAKTFPEFFATLEQLRERSLR